MAIGLLKDLKLIQERVWGATARFKYTDEDGMPWHNEKEPRILVLGIYADPRTGNRNVAGIDLKDVVSRYGMKGLEALRRNLPHILFTDFKGSDQGESLSDVAMNAAIENAFSDENVIIEAARPLKGADAGAPGTLGRWRYGAQGDPDKVLNAIFTNCYRTYRMDRMGPATQSKLYAIEKSDEEKLAQAYKEIEKVEKEWEGMSKQEKLQAKAADADKNKATPDKAIGKEPEPEVVEPEISKPPEEPDVVPEEPPGLKVSPKKYKRDIEIPLPEEPKKKKPKEDEFETSAEEEVGGLEEIDDEDIKNLAKIQVAKAQEQNDEAPIAKRRKALLKAKQEPEEIEEPKKKPEVLKAKPKPKQKDEDEIIELD